MSVLEFLSLPTDKKRKKYLNTLPTKEKASFRAEALKLQRTIKKQQQKNLNKGIDEDEIMRKRAH